MTDMKIARIGDRDFFLFLDIFVHWSGRKITATAPYYGDDIDWVEHGVDLEEVVLTVDGHRVKGRYIPHRLESWEPCILFDFEDPVLAVYLRDHDTIMVTMTAGPHEKQVVLNTEPAEGHDVAMSIIVRDCNQWLPYFLDYYITCLGADHVYLYDNQTRDQQQLQRIIRPHVDRGEVSYIPWHYRWRNTVDKKQIGQIPQQAHSLNKFGRCRWIGFFDYDEFLRIPGRTLKQFLADYDPVEIDGLAFGLRWLMYKGERELDEVGNPLLNFFDAKNDQLGRKRQKLIVSPRNVRFLRIHWLEDGKQEVAVDDSEIYFHHYYLNPDRFERGKTEQETARDDYMLGFAEPLIRATRARAGGNDADNGSESSGRILRAKPRTAEEWIAHVLAAFDIAETEGSKLSDEVLGLHGMCGRRNRHFFNALCGFEGCRYLEIGSHAGASLCAAMYSNEISAVAIENWSQFGTPRTAFMAATNEYRGGGELRLIEQDCFTVDPADLGTFDVYYYDGDHSAESQTRAIKRFYECLEDRAVVIIDDWNREPVREGTRRAMTELNVPIIFEKEIILPEADIIGMPHHRGSDTWWDGIYVMIVDKQAAALSASTRPRAIAEAGNGTLDQRLPIEVIIFSKDRACQIEALLRSMARFFEHPHRTTVLYTTSDSHYQLGYDVLTNRYDGVTWKREVDFRTDLLRLIDDAGERAARNVMFLVDDIVFTRRFTGEQMIELLDQDEDILALSLRLGDKIRYCHPRGAETAPPDFLDGRRWRWRDAHPGYWDYPMSVDGNIYRLSDIAELLPKLDYRRTGQLEAFMAGQPIDRPYLVCHPAPYLVNLALNIVQDVYNNPHGDLSAEALNRSFLDGFAIDIEPFAGREFSACHIEPDIALIRQPREMHVALRKPDWIGGATEPAVSEAVTPVKYIGEIEEKPWEDGVVLRRPGSDQGVILDRSGYEIWALCDGVHTARDMVQILSRKFDCDDNQLRMDVLATLHQFEQHDLVTLPTPAIKVSGQRRTLDLRDVPFYVINREGDDDRRAFIERQLRERGLTYELVRGITCEPQAIGVALSHLRILRKSKVTAPFVILEDDCAFSENFRYTFEVPEESDALYLGVSGHGVQRPGELSWGQGGTVRHVAFDGDYLRVFNMLSRHGIVFLTEAFREAAIRMSVEALTHHTYTFPGDVGYAVLQSSHLVLTPNKPICFQSEPHGGRETDTKPSLLDLGKR